MSKKIDPVELIKDCIKGRRMKIDEYMMKKREYEIRISCERDEMFRLIDILKDIEPKKDSDKLPL